MIDDEDVKTPPEGIAAAPGEPPKLPELAGTTGTLTAEDWAKKLETPDWLFAAARVGLQWPRGQEMTEKTYREGIDWAAKAPCR
jgi:hypothetical protein